MPKLYSDHADAELEKCATLVIRTDGKFFSYDGGKKQGLIDFIEYLKRDEYLNAAFERGLRGDLKTRIDCTIMPAPITLLPNKIPLGFQPNICRAHQIFVEESFLLLRNTNNKENFLRKMRAGRYVLNTIRKLKLNDENEFNRLLNLNVSVLSTFVPWYQSEQKKAEEKPKPPLKLPFLARK